MKQLYPRLDEDGKPYILCDCMARRYVAEGAQTECTKCGAHYTFYVEQTAPPIGRA